ncbi:MAG: DnaA N-terminal domain-containing protein, partial [Microvirgula sp.]
MTDLSAFWPQCLARFEAELSPQQFNTWIKPLVCVVSDEGVVLYAQNRFSLGFVKDRFLARIETLAEALFGDAVSVELRIGGAAATTAPGEKAPRRAAVSSETGDVQIPAESTHTQQPRMTAPKPAIGGGHESTRLNPAFTFESLVTGKGNQ